MQTFVFLVRISLGRELGQTTLAVPTSPSLEVSMTISIGAKFYHVLVFISRLRMKLACGGLLWCRTFCAWHCKTYMNEENVYNQANAKGRGKDRFYGRSKPKL